jgi:hypothetical protein
MITLLLKMLLCVLVNLLIDSLATTYFGQTYSIGWACGTLCLWLNLSLLERLDAYMKGTHENT